MTKGPPPSRGGFSLLELLTTMIVISILAAIALPNFRAAAYSADASKVATDIEVVRTAIFEFYEAANRLPSSARWGLIPPDLAPHFNNVQFTYKDLDYRLVTNVGRGRVEFRVRYPRGSPIGAALQRFRRPGNGSGSVTWTATQTRWRLLEDNQ